MSGTRALLSRPGVFDFRIKGDVNVLVGCRLGGTSLINANVCQRPAPSLLEDDRWPAPLRGGLEDELRAGYDRAVAMLQPQQYPGLDVLASPGSLRSNRRRLLWVRRLRTRASP